METKLARKTKDGVKRIKAMRDGVEGLFSQRAWDLGKMEKEGWIRVGVVSDAVKVDVEEIEIVDIPIDPEKEADDIYPTDDEIRAFLKEKGIKFHHATGTKKLRGLFDENKK